MKRIALLIISLLSLTLISPVSAASDPNLYFDDAVFDYYLEKTETGTKMKVKETLKAVFSNNSISHGPTRIIPFTNQAGKNITIDNLKITATRNGVSEPIANVEKTDNFFRVNIGSSSRTVQGEQTYVLEYEFNNVITEYDTSGRDVSGSGGDHQELYWDTNGTGWPNAFNSITANVHFAGDYAAKDQAYCYTGSQGSSGRDCTVTKNSDGFTFKTTRKLNAYENLTYDIEFPAGTFKVPLSQNYILVISTAVVAVLGALAVLFEVKKYRKYASEKAAYAKSLLVAPQYTPINNLTVAEAGMIYTELSKPTQTATLLELAINHKIQIVSGKTTSTILKREKTAWSIKILDDKDLTSPQKIVLEIINGGSLPSVGEVVTIERQTATQALANLAKKYPKDARQLLIKKKYFEPNVNNDTGRIKTTREGKFTGVFMALLVCATGLVTFLSLSGASFMTYGNIIGKDYLIFIIWAITILPIIIAVAIDNSGDKYSARTTAGLDASNYYEGLKLYISMAEKERLEFNQSAKNAPRDEKGLVKLYEKLLPYACLFGLEESWLKEIQKYYEALNYSPDWYYGDDILTYAMLNSMVATTSSTISNNTSWHDASSSSGFSGGGGGGFSGGGGGGGGGGSW